MVNRKKRLKRGIESLNEQIIMHLEKKKKAEKDGKLELVNYYEKEILRKEQYKKKKEELLKKNKLKNV